jgi:hypothetical protein
MRGEGFRRGAPEGLGEQGLFGGGRLPGARFIAPSMRHLGQNRLATHEKNEKNEKKKFSELFCRV